MAEHPDVTKLFGTLKNLKEAGDVRGMVDKLGELLQTVSKTFKPDDLAHSLQTLRGSVATLKADTDQCQRRFEIAFTAWLPETKDQGKYALVQFETRQLIRTFFAEVDGTIYSMRQVLLWAQERGEIDLSIAESALLREEAYKFDSNAKSAKVIPSFLSSVDSFLLTFSIMPRLFASASSLDLSKYGWQAFRELLEVRHSVTHPKQIIHLVVDAKVITKVLPAARSWYYDSLIAAVADPELSAVVRGAA